MNYKYHYTKLIETRKFLNRTKIKGDGKYHKHHIIPKCYGGSNNSENLILLTPREHYIAHWLLWKIHGNKMALAFFRMRHADNTILNITSKVYAKLKFEHSITMKFINKNVKHSVKSYRQQAQKIKGIKNCNADVKCYVFYNNKKEKIFIGDRYSFSEKYNLNLNSIGDILNKNKSLFGWKRLQ